MPSAPSAAVAEIQFTVARFPSEAPCPVFHSEAPHPILAANVHFSRITCSRILHLSLTLSKRYTVVRTLPNEDPTDVGLAKITWTDSEYKRKRV